jgi:hypothetical protein
MNENDTALKSKGCLLPCRELSKISYATVSKIPWREAYANFLPYFNHAISLFITPHYLVTQYYRQNLVKLDL